MVAAMGFFIKYGLNMLHFSYSNEFPSNFESLARKILKLLFHIVAHLYHCHFREIVLLNLHAHLNCVFSHLIILNDRYQLIEPRETEILQDLIIALRILDKENTSASLNRDSSANSMGVNNTMVLNNSVPPSH
ncbi:MOB kinase activator-like 2 [Diaphorina citri]|uniref:MOB kinase activator-like 2 n=1 Tax=Diaphorina citri TaxID=121845 RepID=A0A3Q0JLH3_DIACI|nr:MOB kinase activator-like 2 [Diaphorina citri]